MGYRLILTNISFAAKEIHVHVSRYNIFVLRDVRQFQDEINKVCKYSNIVCKYNVLSDNICK